jgi:hypothetical protein
VTLTIEFPPTTVVTESLEWSGALRPQASWAQAATWAHGLLCQTLADEVVDELIWSAEAGLDRTAFVVPKFLAG